jgi:L,D-peptidoglycan transpeptidase YkuD (ErfK/YbiS/YcfS/YnhG family)
LFVIHHMLLGTDRQARRLRYIAAACGVLLAAAAWIQVRTVESRREVAMQASADAATAAIRQARTVDAMTWAPDELLAAESAARGALVAQRIEETRFWPIPNAARVTDAYAEAERGARQARVLAGDRHTAAARATASAIADAAEEVGASAGPAAAVHLDPDRRSVQIRAQLALDEARVYEREGDLASAYAHAREAQDLAGQVRDHAAAVAARYADAETLARWRRWKEETIAWSRRERRAAIVVAKEAHLLTLYVAGAAVKTYAVDLGFNWIADKARAGDDATPEGRYHIVSQRAGGAFHRELLLDYPNAEDRAEFNRARRNGDLPPSAGIGGAIEIHGEGGRGRDWTQGCVAVKNTDMDDLYRRVAVGTPVTIVGSDDFGAIAEFATQHRDGRSGRQH